MTQPHVEPPQIHIIKENQYCKSDNDSLKLKLCRYPTSHTLGLFQFKTSMFGNGKPEEFLLIVCNFNITLSASQTLEVGAKYQYLHTLVRREALCQLILLSADVERAEKLNFDSIIRYLAQYFPLYI